MPILSLVASNPLVDGRQSERASMVRRGTARLLIERGYALIGEFALASGRRADLIGMDGKGRFVIVEIKSSVEDYRADHKWPGYRDFCDAFYFATHAGVPRDIFPEDEGLIVADWHGADILREAEPVPLAGATRKALTMRFARAAAGRLERVLTHCANAGEALPGDLVAIDGR